MACCAISAYVIYRILSIHGRIAAVVSSSPAPKRSAGFACGLGSSPSASDQHAVTKWSTVRLRINGMTCASCTNDVKAALELRNGVLRANVSLAVSQATVAFDPALVSKMTLIDSVASAGFDAELVKAGESWSDGFKRSEVDRKTKIDRERLDVNCVVFLAALVVLLGNLPTSYQTSDTRIAESLLAIFTVVVGVRSIHVEAYRAALAGRADMSTLSSLALLTGLFKAFVLDFKQSDTSLYHITTLAATVMGARLVKSLVARKSFSAFATLAQQMPSHAYVEDGKNPSKTAQDALKMMPLDLLEVGDIVTVPANHAVPADGDLKDDAWLSETHIHGELLPRHRRSNEQIFAGSLNQGSEFRMCVTAVGNATMLERTLRCVTEADITKGQTPESTDAWLGLFTKCVILFSVAVCFSWRFYAHSPWSDAISRAIAVLSCACPCALALSVPTCLALVVGVCSSRYHALMTGGMTAIRSLSESRFILFDKTGTLTSPELSFESLILETKCDEAELDPYEVWRVVKHMEEGRTHPVAVVLANEASLQLEKGGPGMVTRKLKLVEMGEVQETVGLGVAFQLQEAGLQKTVLVGSARFLRSNGIRVPLATTSDVQRKKKVYVSLGDEVIATIVLKEQLRADASGAIARLQALGYKVGMISGDSFAAVAAVATELGLPGKYIWSEKLPEEKAAVISQLQAQFGSLIMVGDGMNDLPALSTADFSFGMPSDASAVETLHADAILLPGAGFNETLARIADIILLARMTATKVRQNLMWAIVYNIVALALSAGILESWNMSLTPFYASLGMSMSSVLVLMNSLGIETGSSIMNG